MAARPSWPRALLAFLALPGVVGYALPLALARPALAGPYPHPAGAALVLAGTALLVRCVREFHVAGQGTLAPWSPPARLVTTGPYRFTRNPMYLAVFAVLLGWWLVFGRPVLALYALGFAVAVALRVPLVEEPWAVERFGGEWQAYRARVPRWIFRGL